MTTDSTGTEPDLRVLCNRVEVLEQQAGSAAQSDSYLWNRIGELKRSERSLLLRLYRLASASHLPSMQHSQRLDQRLHMLREEVRTMTQEKERGERLWRERLQRCQRQLKAKEEEMSRQSQYFENFKAQLQHKLSLARDREQSLQNRIYTLEKQLLDVTVSAATGMATLGAARITAGPVTHWEEQERLISLRGEGEGEEEKKEERRRQWQPSVGFEREGGREGDEGKTEKEIEGGNKDTKQSSNEARLQGFILSLQEDLRVLLERQEDGMTERKGLVEQLQEAQENGHFLGCKVEEMKAEVHQLQLSEGSLAEEAEELREENRRLQRILREAANQTPTRSPAAPESACLSPGMSSPSCSPAVCPGLPSAQPYTTAKGNSSMGSSGEVQPTLNGGINQSHSPAVPRLDHREAAESKQNDTEAPSSPAKSDPLNLFARNGFKQNPSFQSLSMTTETIDEFKLGTWCSGGLLNLEESPSEESDALREAYRSLGFGEDLEALREQRERLEAALQHAQGQLEVVARENARLKLQLRKQAEEPEAEQGSPAGKIGALSHCDGADRLQSSPTQDAQDDLAQALNRENRALADRIQELLAHIELREEEDEAQQAQLRERISTLEEDRGRLEQEGQEQVCLITELTRKTEDDLNTIMELQQRLDERGERGDLEESVDRLVESVLKGEEEEEEEPQPMSSQQADRLTAASSPAPQRNSPHGLSQNPSHARSLTEQVDHLTRAVRSLQTERDELAGSVSSLREQQAEVALSVRTQTEEKQQLTRTVWGLKEEKDHVSNCLSALKQERERLSRAVCGLREERDHFARVKEEREQLAKSLSGLEREKAALTESLSGRKEELDQITRSLQSLQTESEQLSRAVLSLKRERDELTASLEGLKERRGQEDLRTQDDRDELTEAVGSLREEKARIEHALACLRREETQTALAIQGLREERSGLQPALPNQTHAEDRNQRRRLANPNSCGATTTTMTTQAASRCQTHSYEGNFVHNSAQNGCGGEREQSGLTREADASGAQLTGSLGQPDQSGAEAKRLRGELCRSEARREEAERRAAEEGRRLTDVAGQMGETRRENESLNTQIEELRSRLTGLVREKTDALSLKTQAEEQYNILTAQLKAKTVALEELNCEYIALKRGQGSRDDLSAALVSLRTRYNDIRAKYDALLKKRSQTDLDAAPLKAKVSCLVAKCQERNGALARLMAAARGRGRVDAALAQQVEGLLGDAALRDYTAAFAAPGSVTRADAGLTPRFLSKLQDSVGGFIPDQTLPAREQRQNVHTPDSGADLKREKHVPVSTTESSANPQGCRSGVTPAAAAAAAAAQKQNANSPVPTAPAQERAGVLATPLPPALKESFTTNTAQPSTSASGPVLATGGAERSGCHRSDAKGKSSPDPTRSPGRSPPPPPPPPPCSSTRLSPSRRLSSPEKIINLHEQLQRTLMMSGYKAPASRGRRQEPGRSLSLSAPADLDLAPLTNEWGFAFRKPHANVKLQTPGRVERAAAATAAASKPTTLFHAVASRSANVTFRPGVFTRRHLKADASGTGTSAPPGSSSRPIAAMAPDEARCASTSPKRTERGAADTSDATHAASPPLTLRTAALDPDVLTCPDANPKATASDGTARGKSTAPASDVSNGAATACDGLTFAASGAPSAPGSPERSSGSAAKSPAALDQTKTARPRPGAPAEVRSVEVVKTVGLSSLLIGWERPPLDELGCSNGTFVYGYRVFIDGDFHKSVMSSACTKCVVENVDLSVPVHIGVQTLGSNGLSSHSVHATYGASVGTERR